MVVKGSKKKNSSKKQRVRKSLTLEPKLLEKLTDLRGKIIQTTQNDWSISSLVNILTLAGIMSSKRLSAKEWKDIIKMVENKKILVDTNTINECVSKLS